MLGKWKATRSALKHLFPGLWGTRSHDFSVPPDFDVAPAWPVRGAAYALRVPPMRENNSEGIQHAIFVTVPTHSASRTQCAPCGDPTSRDRRHRRSGPEPRRQLLAAAANRHFACWASRRLSEMEDQVQCHCPRGMRRIRRPSSELREARQTAHHQVSPNSNLRFASRTCFITSCAANEANFSQVLVTASRFQSGGAV